MTEPSITPRAKAIAAGLVRTTRATKFRAVNGFLRADGVGETYWITGDGTRVLRGDVPAVAEELQPGFLEKMVRAGTA